ncbi:hypothetical protein HNV12_11165 [Methanococcoides sp. SA1]|uniref:Haloacid dehalogenase n=1 Tax=Candidatus Desulfatifera sulfidica TaxID=2841691 RepID=A0A8J6N8R4_9BACT|nr:hypothetical protein [Candidatus Desulfatifera sulfidica]NPE28508.1 hypothetical protein [Methanococcoides sp. SA1]
MQIEVEQIGFDLDGVIADTAEAFIRLACEEYDFCSYTLNDITSFQVEDCLNMPTELVEKIFYAILKDSLATGLQPMSGAVEVISQMATTAPVTIITARPLEQPVSDWLDHHFSTETCSRIMLVAMGDHDDKARYIHDHKLRYFVDDRAETCHNLQQQNIIPLVFDQPWNRGRHQLHSVTSWQEIHSLLQLPENHSS